MLACRTWETSFLPSSRVNPPYPQYIDLVWILPHIHTHRLFKQIPRINTSDLNKSFFPETTLILSNVLSVCTTWPKVCEHYDDITLIWVIYGCWTLSCRAAEIFTKRKEPVVVHPLHFHIQDQMQCWTWTFKWNMCLLRERLTEVVLTITGLDTVRSTGRLPQADVS